MKIENLLFSSFLQIAFFASTITAAEAMHQADSLFELRNMGFSKEHLIANYDMINRSIQCYKKAFFETNSNNLRHEAVWKCLRAFYFLGQYATEDKDGRKSVYSQAIKFGEQMEREFPESVEIATWLGILWSRWAESHGILAAAREGVAGKIKHYGEKAVRLDERYLDGGGYRLLGMVYLRAPKIPVLLPWPSREKALEFLQKAQHIAPGNLLNKLYLAQALYENDQQEQARALLSEIIAVNHLVHDVAVDAQAKREARTFLSEKWPQDFPLK